MRRYIWRNLLNDTNIKLTISLAVMSLLAALAVLSSRNNSEFDRYEMHYNLTQIRRLDSLNKVFTKLASTLPSKIYISGDSVNVERVIKRLGQVEKQLQVQANVTLGLRQAINPLKPDEILTIARLQDEIKILESANQTLEKQFVEKQKNFQEEIIRSVESSNKQTYLILAVLTPLIVNFLYQLWKDVKSNQEKPEKKSTE